MSGRYAINVLIQRGSSLPSSPGSYPPRLVAGHEIGRRAPARLLLEIDIGQRLAVVVPDDVAGAVISSTVHGDGKRRGVFTRRALVWRPCPAA